MEHNLVKGLSPQFKSNYLRLIAAGHVEATALAYLEVDWLDFFDICSRDPEFRTNIEEARRCRADVWVDRIAHSLDKTYSDTVEMDGKQVIVLRPPNKDELGVDKLNFEKLKFLAQADNPEKYAAGGKSKVAIEFEMKDFKLLTMDQAKEVINNDPFAKPINAEFKTVEEKPHEQEN